MKWNHLDVTYFAVGNNVVPNPVVMAVVVFSIGSGPCPPTLDDMSETFRNSPVTAATPGLVLFNASSNIVCYHCSLSHLITEIS